MTLCAVDNDGRRFFLGLKVEINTFAIYFDTRKIRAGTACFFRTLAYKPYLARDVLQTQTKFMNRSGIKASGYPIVIFFLLP